MNRHITKSGAQETILAAIRGVLLPKLLPGEIRMKDVERFEKLDSVSMKRDSYG